MPELSFMEKGSFETMSTFQEITEQIKNCESKLRDNCNIIGQLKKEDKALRTTIKLLKRKRFVIAMGRKP